MVARDEYVYQTRSTVLTPQPAGSAIPPSPIGVRAAGIARTWWKSTAFVISVTDFLSGNLDNLEVEHWRGIVPSATPLLTSPIS